MKTKLVTAILVTLSTFTAWLGCSPNERLPDELASETRVAPRAPQANTNSTLESMKDDLSARREQFVSAMDKKLNELGLQIDELATKSETLKNDAKVQAEQAVADLRQQRDQVKQRIQEAKEAGTEVWQGIKTGLAATMDELEKACERAKAKFD